MTKYIERSIAFALAAAFFVWIIPMGAFIKPSQEESACGGKRAICMCSHMKAESKSAPTEGCSVRNNSNINEKDVSGAGGGSQYLSGHSADRELLRSSILHNAEFPIYRSSFFKSIEHVPIHSFPLAF